MIKVLARPTINAEQLYGQKKEANLSTDTAQNFALVCMRFLASTGSTSHFCHLFPCQSFWRSIKICNLW